MAKDRSLGERLERKVVRRNRGSLSMRAKMRMAAAYGKFFDADAKRTLKGGRYSMLRQIPKGGHAAEVGVWKGDFSAALLAHTEPSKLYLVDPWRMPDEDIVDVILPPSKDGEVKRADGSTLEDQQDLDGVYQSVVARFAPNAAVQVLRATSLEAAPQVQDGSLDWVYIDGSHYYEDVLDDLDAWYPKVKRGGIIFGDDYYWRDPDRNYGVRQAVNEFREKVPVVRWVVFRGQFMLWV